MTVAHAGAAVLWVAGICLVAVFGGSTARGDDATDLAKFAGSYQFAGTDDEGMAIIDKAIEAAVSQMNKVKALVVSKILEANKRFIKQVKIDLPSGRIHVKLDEMDLEAKPGETKSLDAAAGSAKLTFRLKGGKIEQVIETDRGAFTTVYELAQGGSVLQRDITVTDKWLDKPVRYRLTYKRR